MAVPTVWGGPFCGSPCNKSPTIWGPNIRVPHFWKLPYKDAVSTFGIRRGVWVCPGSKSLRVILACSLD